MGYWGMGITQSDEYCDVYERFMEEYDDGKPVADITKEILQEYLDEFEDCDGVLHDVYFALGKAEWMCGGISDLIFNRIRHIVEKGENLAFLRELGSSETDLKIRKKKLDAFLQALSIPRGKTRKRKFSKIQYESKSASVFSALPDLQIGDVFAYLHKNEYRIFAVVRRENVYDHPSVFAYAWKKAFPRIPALDDLRQEYILPLGHLFGNTFPKESCICIGNMPDLKILGRIYRPKVINQAWEPSTWAIAQAKDILDEYPLCLCLTLHDVLERIRSFQEHPAQ